MDDYLRILPSLYPDHSAAIESMRPWAERQARGEAVVWTTLEGFFWFPRTLMGFETMMPGLPGPARTAAPHPHRSARLNLRLLDQMRPSCVPTFTTIAEDMSYNHGPMISRKICEEFMTPYYLPLLERVKEMNAVAIMEWTGTAQTDPLDPVGSGSGRRAAAGAAAKVDGTVLSQAHPKHQDDRPLQQTRDWTRARGHARRLREAGPADEYRRIYSQRRSPDPAGGFIEAYRLFLAC